MSLFPTIITKEIFGRNVALWFYYIRTTRFSWIKGCREKPIIEMCQDTFEVGIGKGIEMLELEPMKNDMNLKSNGNMGAMISILCYK
jgi:hypothetical protein